VNLDALSLQPAEALAAGSLERLADVPIYFADPLVRRAESLQRTRDARAPQARMNAATLASLGLASGERVRVAQGGGEAVVEAVQDDTVAAGVVRLATAHASTAGLASMFGAVTVARA
jgi:NADH-quinone oxidoreductase subunit G